MTMTTHAATSASPRNQPVPVKEIEQRLTAIFTEIDHELGTPPDGRDAGTYQRLADLHRREASWWKEYLTAAKARLTWLAASAAADRAHQLATRYQFTATAMTGRPDTAREFAGEVDPGQREGRQAA